MKHSSLKSNVHDALEEFTSPYYDAVSDNSDQ